MPRVRKGPTAPRRSLAGKSGTNRPTPTKGAGTSGRGHEAHMKFNRGLYGKSKNG